MAFVRLLLRALFFTFIRQICFASYGMSSLSLSLSEIEDFFFFFNWNDINRYILDSSIYTNSKSKVDNSIFKLV